jgi:hypothetical protein
MDMTAGRGVMKQFLLFTLLGLAFVIGFTSIAVTIWPPLSAPNETAALIKEVP